MSTAPTLTPSRASRAADELAIARHYDELDVHYRAIWGDHVHHGYWITGRERPDVATRQLVDLAARHAGIVPGARVCDVGCGYGATSRVLARDYGAEVTGLTLSPAQHAYAEEVTAGGNPSYSLGSWLDNDLPDASFDAVVAIESIAHMQDKAKAFAECLRVLRPGGRLVVLDWLAAERPRAWERRLVLDPVCREARLPELCTLPAYQAAMIQAGFEPPFAQDISGRVWQTWPRAMGRGVRQFVRDSGFRRFLFDPTTTDRGFVLSMARLSVGYASGGFRYGLFEAHRPMD